MRRWIYERTACWLILPGLEEDHAIHSNFCNVFLTLRESNTAYFELSESVGFFQEVVYLLDASVKIAI